MNTELKTITLDVNDNKSYEYIYTKQYDVGRIFVINILKDGEPYNISGTEIVLEAKKPDGTTILDNENCKLTSSNQVTVTITEQMTAKEGKVEFQISFIKDSVIITTVSGYIKVDKSAVQHDDIESSSEYNVITDLLLKIEEVNTSVNLAKIYMETSQTASSNAKTYADNALQYSTDAKTYAEQASESAQEASDSEANAKVSETNASSSETNAKTSETNAKSSEEVATQSATNAENYAKQSKSYAIGSTDYRENEDVDNAKYYYEQVKGISSGLQGGLLPMGTITFSELSSQTKSAGYMYNISDSFTTDDTFKEGSGYSYPAGTNVYYTVDGYWDCFAGVMVTGVKGSSETSYRNGNVNITATNIGLGNVDNTADINKNVNSAIYDSYGNMIYSIIVTSSSDEEPTTQKVGDFWMYDY